MRLLLSAAAAAALLAGLQGAAAQAASPKPTLEDCKQALQSLSTPPYTTSLPFLAAATGRCGCGCVFGGVIGRVSSRSCVFEGG